MTRRYLFNAALLATAIASTGTAPAIAQTIDFEGTRQNVNPLSPPGTGRCAPTYFNTVTIAPGAVSSSGSSNIGPFASTQSHCIVSAPPTDVVDGEFTYKFRAGDSITGTYAGRVDSTATPGTFIGTENLVITGGTGRFVGASGTILETGPIVFANGLATFSGTVDGQITASAATTSGDFATATGAPSAALGNYASAYGAYAIGNGERTTALGSFAEATALGATAVGDQTVASGPSSTALGQLAEATAPAATALGHNSDAFGLGSTAVGVRAQATGVGAASVGRLSGATADGATALGAGAIASAAGSVALGAGSVANQANTVSVGAAGAERRIANLAAGTSPTDAVNLSQLGAEAAARAAADTALSGQLGGLGTRVSALEGQLSLLDERLASSTAVAVAMGGAVFLPNVKFNLSANVATYDGAHAGSLQIGALVAENVAVNAGVATGFNKHGKTAGRVGFTIGW